MADMTDVAKALVSQIQAILTPQAAAITALGIASVQVYQGWPNADQLAKDLEAGRVHVSVFSRPIEKITSLSCGNMGWVEASTTTATLETRRQSKQFQITIWAGCFDKRDPIASLIDSSLSTVNRIVMPDGTVTGLAYNNSNQNDDAQKAGIYRRDLIYTANYATIQTMEAAPIASVSATLAAEVNGTAISSSTITATTPSI